MTQTVATQATVLPTTLCTLLPQAIQLVIDLRKAGIGRFADEKTSPGKMTEASHSVVRCNAASNTLQPARFLEAAVVE
jgi:hypothetical protein